MSVFWSDCDRPSPDKPLFEIAPETAYSRLLRNLDLEGGEKRRAGEVDCRANGARKAHRCGEQSRDKISTPGADRGLRLCFCRGEEHASQKKDKAEF